MELSRIYVAISELKKNLSSVEYILNDLGGEISLGGIKPIEFSEDTPVMDIERALAVKMNEIIHAVNELTEEKRT